MAVCRGAPLKLDIAVRAEVGRGVALAVEAHREWESNSRDQIITVIPDICGSGNDRTHAG